MVKRFDALEKLAVIEEQLAEVRDIVGVAELKQKRAIAALELRGIGETDKDGRPSKEWNDVVGAGGMARRLGKLDIDALLIAKTVS